MMPGMIMGWHGSVATIPSGWHLCDGNAGTIDLRDKFIVGAGGDHLPGATGGSDTQVHDFTGDGHVHAIGLGTYIEEVYPAGDRAVVTTTNPATGTTDSADNRPAFYAFCWIQKL